MFRVILIGCKRLFVWKKYIFSFTDTMHQFLSLNRSFDVRPSKLEDTDKIKSLTETIKGHQNIMR